MKKEKATTPVTFETPEPPQIMHPNSPNERKNKKMALQEHGHRKGKGNRTKAARSRKGSDENP
jgi:hypothetical protein